MFNELNSACPVSSTDSLPVHTAGLSTCDSYGWRLEHKITHPQSTPSSTETQAGTTRTHPHSPCPEATTYCQVTIRCAILSWCVRCLSRQYRSLAESTDVSSVSSGCATQPHHMHTNQYLDTARCCTIAMRF